MNNTNMMTVDKDYTNSDDGCICQESLLGNRWYYRKPKTDQQKPTQSITTLDTNSKVGALTQQILTSRNITRDNWGQYLNPKLRDACPDPAHLLDMDKALAAIIPLIQQGQIIGLFGDYDVDGATSTALMYRYLNSVGAKVVYHIPDRQKEGYGPNINALRDMVSQGARLIITLDCGTLSNEVLGQADEYGIRVIVIDHHISTQQLPKALAIVNPNRFDQKDSPCRHLAAVGVAFMVLIALNRALNNLGIQGQDLFKLLDLVALGTVCDVVELSGLNRAYVWQGLNVMRMTDNCGLRALCQVAGVKNMQDLKSYNLGFMLGPRINAGGRVGESELGVKLLTTDNMDEAMSIANKLDFYNHIRKETQQKMFEQADQQAQEYIEQNPQCKSLVLHHTQWHQGIIGIIAGRIKEKYYRPTAVIAFEQDEEIGKASCRSVEEFNVGQAIHEASDDEILISGGGHAMAGGFSIIKDNINKFHEFMEKKLSTTTLNPTLYVDCAVSIEMINMRLLNDFSCLEPFGAGNPSIKILLNNVSVEYAKVVGQDHISCKLVTISGAAVPAIAFKAVGTQLHLALMGNKSIIMDIVGSLNYNDFQGTPQLIIDDIRLCN